MGHPAFVWQALYKGQHKCTWSQHLLFETYGGKALHTNVSECSQSAQREPMLSSARILLY